MTTFDIRLLNASYDFDTNDVELYGRTRNGSSVTVLVSGFSPYFYAVAPRRAVERLLRGKAPYNINWRLPEEKKLYHRGRWTTCTK